MTKNTLIRFRNFVLLVLVQVLIFSRIHLFGYATACIYIIFIIKLPRHTTRNELLIWSFLFGLCVDMFCNTPGINAAAATLLGFVRNPLLSAFAHKGIPDDFIPGARSLNGADTLYIPHSAHLYFLQHFSYLKHSQWQIR